MGVVPKTQTHTNKTMTDRYKCGPNLKTQTQIDKTMTDRYKYGPKNTN